MNFELDPDRDTPPLHSCYTEPPCGGAHHPGLRHAETWDEIGEYVSAGAVVCDRDGDRVVACDIARNVVTLDGGSEYNYRPDQVLIEDISLIPPASPEEEEAALASIMESFGNRRLANPGDPLQ